MRIISVDLEMNQPSRKIIQIGAVCFQPDSGKIVEIFNELVQPGELLHPEIVELTGITDEALVSKDNVVQAATRFSEFKKRLQINAVAVTWGGAGSRFNDVSQIYEEAAIENPYRRPIIDVKSVYRILANASSAGFRQDMGLEKACEHVGINWDDKYGAPHDALADAYNTMRLYMFLSKIIKGGFAIKQG